MTRRYVTLLLAFAVLSVASCGVATAPLRVIGGTARGVRALAEKPADAFADRRARKAAERRREETREASARANGPSLSGESPEFGSSPSLGGDPTPDLGPLPEERELPAAPMRAPADDDRLPER